MKKFSIAFACAMALASFGCKKKGGGDALGKMNEFADEMCKCKDGETDCAKKVQDKMTKWSEEQAKNADKNATATQDPEEAKKYAEVSKKMTECATKAMTPAANGTPPAGDKPAGDKPAGDKPADGSAAAGDKPAGDKPMAAGGDLPAECGDYKAAIEKLASCDKLPQASRDALKTSFDTMANSWKDFGSMPAEAKKAAADACKQAADAVNQAAQVCK